MIRREPLTGWRHPRAESHVCPYCAGLVGFIAIEDTKQGVTGVCMWCASSFVIQVEPA